MKSTKQIFQLLRGSWRFYRTITKSGIVEGSAEFTSLKNNLLHYHERGFWQRSFEDKVPIYKKYHYELSEDEETINTYFDDDGKQGALFLNLQFDQTSTAGASHLCKKDTYNATFQFFSEDKLLIRYKVQGPQKAYTTETLYTRSSDPSFSCTSPR